MLVGLDSERLLFGASVSLGFVMIITTRYKIK